MRPGGWRAPAALRSTAKGPTRPRYRASTLPTLRVRREKRRRGAAKGALSLPRRGVGGRATPGRVGWSQDGTLRPKTPPDPSQRAGPPPTRGRVGPLGAERSPTDARHPPGRTAQSPPSGSNSDSGRRGAPGHRWLYAYLAGRPALHARRLVHRSRKPRSGRGRPAAPCGVGPFADPGLAASGEAPSPKTHPAPYGARRRGPVLVRGGRPVIPARRKRLARPAADVPGPRAPVLAGAGAAPPPHGRPVRTRLPVGEGHLEESTGES